MDRSYKYILFDWDGCLAKTLDIWFWAEKDHLSAEGIEIEDNDLVKSFGDWDFGKKLGVKDNDKFIRELVADVDEKMKSVKLYDNVNELLVDLKNMDVKMAIVTTAKQVSISSPLDRYDLRKHFDVILAAEDVLKHKPDPEIVLKAMGLLGANKDETLIIGDGPKDVAAGKAAGITTVSFYPKDNEKYYSEEDIKSYGADFVIHDLLDLVKIVS